MTITGACNNAIYGGRCMIDAKALGERVQRGICGKPRVACTAWHAARLCCCCYMIDAEVLAGCNAACPGAPDAAAIATTSTAAGHPNHPEPCLPALTYPTRAAFRRHTQPTACPICLPHPPAGRIIHADNSGFLPSFSVKFENIRFTNGQAEGLGGAFFNQGKLQVRGC